VLFVALQEREETYGIFLARVEIAKVSDEMNVKDE